jgi:hypothetical protein
LINAGKLEEAEWALTKIARFNNKPDFVLDQSMFGKNTEEAVPYAYSVVVERKNGRRIDIETVGSVKAYANLNPHRDHITRSDFKESIIEVEFEGEGPAAEFKQAA